MSGSFCRSALRRGERLTDKKGVPEKTVGALNHLKACFVNVFFGMKSVGPKSHRTGAKTGPNGEFSEE